MTDQEVPIPEVLRFDNNSIHTPQAFRFYDWIHAIAWGGICHLEQKVNVARFQRSKTFDKKQETVDGNGKVKK